MAKPTPVAEEDGITRRLDALIRLYIENTKRTDKTFSDTESIHALHSAGLTPTEIAKIMGRKSRSSISNELYAKRKK